MGVNSFDAVIVTGGVDVCCLRANAIELNLPVTGIYPQRFNGWSTFIVLPSGSKMGWQANKEHINKIDQFINLAEESNTFCYYERVKYGEWK